MKLDHQFDKLIRDKLKFHQTEVPEHLWEKIEVQLPRKSNKFIFTLAGIMTISFTLILFYIRMSDAGQPTRRVEYNFRTMLPSEKFASAQINAKKPIPLGENQQELATIKSNIDISHQTKNTGTLYTDNISSSIGVNQTETKFNSSTPINQFEADKLNIIDPKVNLTIPELHKPANIQSLFGHFNTQNRVKYKNKDACLVQFDGYRKKYFLELVNSVDLPVKHLSAMGDDQIKYINARKSTENVFLSFSTGFRAGLAITRNLEIMAGGQFSQINEQFDYTDPESSQTKIIIIKSYVKNSMGETIDSVITQQTIHIPGTHTYKIQNHYRFIDLPIVLGYQIFSKRRFSVFANTGIIANLKFMQKGAILDDDAITISKFNENQPNNIFLENAGFSSYTGINIKYALSPGLQISLEPNLRHQFSSLTNDDYPALQKYTTIGVQGGLRFIF